MTMIIDNDMFFNTLKQHIVKNHTLSSPLGVLLQKNNIKNSKLKPQYNRLYNTIQNKQETRTNNTIHANTRLNTNV